MGSQGHARHHDPPPERAREAAGPSAEVVTAAMPVGDVPGYATAVLRPGRYVVCIPLGAPPEFTAGTTYAEFSVG